MRRLQVLDGDPRGIKQNFFIGDLDREENTTVSFIIEEAKQTVLDFSEGTVKVLWMYYTII